MGVTERRIGLLFALFLALLLVAVARTTWVGVVRGASLQRVANAQQVVELNVPARRGSITDRHGVELAVSEPAADVAATPYLIKSKLKVAAQLAPLLGAGENAVLKKLNAPGGFVYLARNLGGSKVERIRRLNIDGLQFIPSARRDYPRRFLASQVLGVVGIDGEGRTGLEYARDSILRGTNGTRRIVKDLRGQPIVVQEPKRATPGRDIRLTLDAQLQQKVEDVLAQVGQVWRPKGATAVVMDPRTNEILALANWPRRTAPSASTTSPARRSRRSPSPRRSRTRSSRRTRSSACRRRSPSPIARSKRRTRAAGSTSRCRRSSRSPRTSGP